MTEFGQEDREERLALDPLELGTIAAILVVFFLWGPQKIPELARVIGQARTEFEKATKEFQNVTQGLTDANNPLFAPTKPTQSLSQSPKQGTTTPAAALPLQPTLARGAPVKTGDQLLIEAARKLGIATQGKTREQIQQDIIAMAQKQQQEPPPEVSAPAAASPSPPDLPPSEDSAPPSAP
jgi:sec-independent protein translocase protein TatA